MNKLYFNYAGEYTQFLAALSFWWLEVLHQPDHSEANLLQVHKSTSLL
jgi:hypothetical protein